MIIERAPSGGSAAPRTKACTSLSLSWLTEGWFVPNESTGGQAAPSDPFAPSRRRSPSEYSISETCRGGCTRERSISPRATRDPRKSRPSLRDVRLWLTFARNRCFQRMRYSRSGPSARRSHPGYRSRRSSNRIQSHDPASRVQRRRPGPENMCTGSTSQGVIVNCCVRSHQAAASPSRTPPKGGSCDSLFLPLISSSVFAQQIRQLLVPSLVCHLQSTGTVFSSYVDIGTLRN